MQRTVTYLHKIEGLNININHLSDTNHDYFLWKEVEQLLKDNGLWNGSYFQYTKKIYTVTTNLFDFDYIKNKY